MISFRCLAQGFKFVFKSSSKVCRSDRASVTSVTPSVATGVYPLAPLTSDDSSPSDSDKTCDEGATVIPFDGTRSCAAQCIEDFFRSLCGSGSLPDLSGQLAKCDTYPIARGGYGDVWRARFIGAFSNDGYSGRMQAHQVVAVKVIHLVVDDPERLCRTMKFLEREVVHWQKACHQRVLPLLGICNDFDPTFCPSMVSPWMENGNVISFLKQREGEGRPIGRKWRLQIIHEVTEGLRHLHSINIIHGDLKGTNVLIDNHEHARLCDFGLSRLVEAAGKSAITSTLTGSLRWMAPELLGVTRVGGPGNQVIFDAPIRTSTQTDVYAFACVALEILTGHVPYYYIKVDPQVVVEVSRGVMPDTPPETEITREEWEVLLQCWGFDPIERPDVGLLVKIFCDFYYRCD